MDDLVGNETTRLATVNGDKNAWHTQYVYNITPMNIQFIS